MTEEQKKQFEEKARELMKWLNGNGHPHMTIIITQNTAELLEGSIGVSTNEYLRD